MKQISCTVMPPGGGCESESARSPSVNITGGSVLQITLWAKLESLTLHGSAANAAKGPQITAVPMDARGGSQLYASINLSPKAPKAYNISDWRQYSFGITTPENATHISFYTRLQGANVTATWSIADATIVQLDNTLRNIIRTPATDVEVWSADSSKRYAHGVDYSIATPTTKDDADDVSTQAICRYKQQVYCQKQLQATADW